MDGSDSCVYLIYCRGLFFLLPQKEIEEETVNGGWGYWDLHTHGPVYPLVPLF